MPATSNPINLFLIDGNPLFYRLHAEFPTRKLDELIFDWTKNVLGKTTSPRPTHAAFVMDSAGSKIARQILIDRAKIAANPDGAVAGPRSSRALMAMSHYKRHQTAGHTQYSPRFSSGYQPWSPLKIIPELVEIPPEPGAAPTEAASEAETAAATPAATPSESEAAPEDASAGSFSRTAGLGDKKVPWTSPAIPTGPTDKASLMQVYPDYKKKSKGLPAEIREGMDSMMAHNLSGVTIVTRQSTEADDVIASLSKMALASNPNVFVTIVSPDKDFKQLLSPRVSLAGGPTADVTLSFERQRRRWGMVHRHHDPKEFFLGIAQLTGDEADGIPRIPGIDTMLAVDLMLRYGSFERIIEACEKRDLNPPHLIDPILEYRNWSQLSRSLAELNGDIDLGPLLQANTWKSTLELQSGSSP